MLEHVLGSRLKVRILRLMLMNPKRQYTLSEIANALKLSPGSVHFALRDLEQYRILYVNRVGRSKAYAMNDAHVVYPQLESVFKRESDAYRDVAAEFAARTQKQRIKNILLFGSVARGDTLTPGDIDILIVYKPGFDKKNMDGLVESMLDKYEALISPIYLSETEVKDKMKRFDSFILTVMDEGVVLYGDEKWLKRQEGRMPSNS